MKPIYSLFLVILLISCNSKNSQTNLKDSPVIEFENYEYDFGDIEWGSEGTYIFKFTNNGKSPLFITNVRSSCGCTVPDWPKDQIVKNESGEITIKYNTRISGKFSKSVTVYSNANNSPVILKITGSVNKPSNPV